MSKIIAIANQKGGVGKTTTTMSLGAALAMRGRRVLLIDLDPQRNLSSYLGFEGNSNTMADLMQLQDACSADLGDYIRHSAGEQLDYIPSSLLLANAEMQLFSAIGRETTLKRILQNVAFPGYDDIFIDCPPSLGMLTMNAFAAADRVLVPVEVEKFAYDGVVSLCNVLQLIRQTVNPALQLGGIIRVKCDRSNMSEIISQALTEEYGELVLNATISRAKEASNSTGYQRSLVSYGNKLKPQFLALADELLTREARA